MVHHRWAAKQGQEEAAHRARDAGRSDASPLLARIYLTFTEAHFFRTAAGAEVDLLLKLPGRRAPRAIEVKRGLAPKVDRGFHLACDSLRPERRLVVYGGVESFPIAEGIEAISLIDLCAELAAG